MIVRAHNAMFEPVEEVARAGVARKELVNRE
jgi:hypothetical protein